MARAAEVSGQHDPGGRRMGRGFGLWIAGRARRSGDFPAAVLCGAAGKRRVSPKPPSQPLSEGSVLEGVVIRACHFRVSITFLMPADIELRTAERDRVRSVRPVGRVHGKDTEEKHSGTWAHAQVHGERLAPHAHGVYTRLHERSHAAAGVRTGVRSLPGCHTTSPLFPGRMCTHTHIFIYIHICILFVQPCGLR